jgi:hypothetical protein
MKLPIVVLKPGDRVLVSLPAKDLTRGQAEDFRNLLGGRFPGVDFTVIPDAQMLVQPKGGE